MGALYYRLASMNRSAWLAFSAIVPTLAVAQSGFDRRSYLSGLDAYYRGDLNRSRELLHRSLPSLGNSFSESLAFTRAVPTAELAAVYSEIGDYQRAEALFKQAYFWPSHPLMYLRYAEFCIQTGREAKAIQLVKESRRQFPTPVARSLADAVEGEALLETRRLSEAETALQRAAKGLTSAQARYPWDFTWCLVYLARLNIAKRDATEALRLSGEAIKFAQTRWGYYSPAVLAAMEAYGEALVEDGRPEEGRNFLHNSLKLRRAVYPVDAPSVKAAEQRLAAIPNPVKR